ncbi:hypothetical protein MMC06_005880 [Schaereria dolodes]|nr:hypothetical protein [Schaereria dolodes]
MTNLHIPETGNSSKLPLTVQPSTTNYQLDLLNARTRLTYLDSKIDQCIAEFTKQVKMGLAHGRKSEKIRRIPTAKEMKATKGNKVQKPTREKSKPEQQDLTFCDLAIMVFLTLPADILPIISASIIEPTNLNFTTSERLLSARLHLSNIEQQIDQWKEVYETVHDELHHTIRILFRRTQSGASDRHGISQARSWMNKNQEFMKHIREQSTDLVKERKVVRAQIVELTSQRSSKKLTQDVDDAERAENSRD